MAPLPLWATCIKAFAEAARRGRVHLSTGRPAPLRVGSGTTPLSLGESEGYPYEDIAHFYVARRRQSKRSPSREDLQRAYADFLRDAIYEGKSVPSHVAVEIGVVSAAGQVPRSVITVAVLGGGERPLAFADRRAAEAWLSSISIEAKRGLRIMASGHGPERRHWIVRRVEVTAHLRPQAGGSRSEWQFC